MTVLHTDESASFWKAVAARDRASEGRFVCAVITTGVYCRPGCPARLPRRENVRFFLTNAAAEAAGFRPCKRCRPDEPPLAERQVGAIAEACRMIESAEAQLDFASIAASLGMSRHHFHRIFKERTGLTPGAYARARRLSAAQKEMQDGATVTQAIYAAGYGSSSRFYEHGATQLGMKPRSFAKGGAGETIEFACGACSLGVILAAATQTGLCSIQFGDDAEALEKQLREKFSKAHLIEGGKDFRRLLRQVVALVEEPAGAAHLPLDVRGTAFQQRVWEALRRIPPGQTMSYSELAAAIGAPRAVRAVAGACAANRLAVIIPCHRVVGSDGALTGYRWGVERKSALIARERSGRK